MNIHAMRMGPGKHLKGLKLMGGIVEPEEVSLGSRGVPAKVGDISFIVDSSTTSTS